jgi:methionyl-tRNA formyltransferase
MRLIFAGTPANAALALELLAAKHEVVMVITREDAPVGRKRELMPSAVALKAHELNIPTLKRNRLTEGDIEAIQGCGAERAIVVAYGALIPQTLLEVIPWWNLHFSLLPSWRGATPLQHSMLSGGQGAGMTLFELEAGLDTGPILAAQAREIDYSRTCGEQLEDFTRAGSELILETLKTLPSPSAQQGEVTLAPKIGRDQARLDVNSAADVLAWKVMALNPEPGAWAELDGNPVRILRATSLGSTDWDAVDNEKFAPGRISLQSGKVLLHCAEGTRLELKEVQPAGKKVMPATDWYRGLNKEIRLD